MPGPLERRRHRRLYLHQDWKTGVGVDLVELARDGEARLDPRRVREVLGPYELELDGLLMARKPVALAFEKMSEKPDQDKDALEKAYNQVRDMDCAILHMQRENAQRLVNAVPEDKRGNVRDKLLTARAPYVQTRTLLNAKNSPRAAG